MYIQYTYLNHNRIVANQSVGVIQSNQYYPFGMLFAESTSQDKQDFKYNGKELDQMHGLNQYDYSARYYDPAISRFTTMDPLAEKYYSISPYVYVANNPLKFIDPDGRDIRIYYTNTAGKPGVFVFNGNNQSAAPQNKFVGDVIKAYNYNVKNGGGESMRTAATNSKLKINIGEGSGKSRFTSNTSIKVKGKDVTHPMVYWDSKLGLETIDGKTISPATALEHEVTHAVNYATDDNFVRNTKNGTSATHGTKEEENTITGPEAKTAQGNKEVPKGYVRPNHKGTYIETVDPTSNKKK